jgi:thioglycine synthase
VTRAAPIRIGRTPKHGTSGAHRTMPAEATWERLRPLLPTLGVTRLADITGLDRLGIPTYSAVRPTGRDMSISVTCGKGLRPIDAKVGAVMEAVEYMVGEPDAARGTLARCHELPGTAVHPGDFHLPPWVTDVESKTFEWVEAWDIAADQAVWVPAASAYILDPRGDFLFETESSGLASGNCLEEAVFHGLAELVERDADSIAESFIERGDTSRYPLIELDSLPATSAALAQRFLDNEIELYIRDITSELGIACFSVTCIDRRTDQLLVHGGSGAHLVAEIALNRALTEAAQSRAADIQGSREDLTFFRRADRDPRRQDHASWQVPVSSWRRFSEVPSVLHSDVADDVALVLERLAAHGFRRVAVVDLTSPRIGLPAVRVVVPGLEIACADPWRAGPRLARDAQQFPQERWTP